MIDIALVQKNKTESEDTIKEEIVTKIKIEEEEEVNSGVRGDNLTTLENNAATQSLRILPWWRKTGETQAHKVVLSVRSQHVPSKTGSTIHFPCTQRRPVHYTKPQGSVKTKLEDCTERHSADKVDVDKSGDTTETKDNVEEIEAMPDFTENGEKVPETAVIDTEELTEDATIASDAEEASEELRDTVRDTTEDTDNTARMEDKEKGTPTTGEDLMRFMINFKEVMEKKIEVVSNISKEIDKKLEDKLSGIKKGMEEISIEVKSNDRKQDEAGKELARRMDRMEQDLSRIKYSRMQSKSLSGRKEEQIRQQEVRTKDRSKQGTGGEDQEAEVVEIPPEGSKEEENMAGMTRQMSWADEMEEDLRERAVELGVEKEKATWLEDKRQWIHERRQPSAWAKELNGEIKKAGNRMGGTGTGGKEIRKEIRATKAAKRMEGEHRCAKGAESKPRHWFGNSSGSSSESSDEEKDDWNVVGREKKDEERRKRRKIRRSERKAEVAQRAINMAGIGPIMDEEIEVQRKLTKNYEVVKVWAVKNHLSENYKYNQEELNRLNITETKRTNKDEIIYIAVEDGRDIERYLCTQG